MKRSTSVIAILLCVVLLVSLAACADADGVSRTSSPDGNTAGRESEPEPRQTEAESEPAETTEPASAPQETTASDGTVLVIYFSRTGEQYTVGVIDKGNTAIVAEMIAEHTGADLFEVIPADGHYPMTYDELTDVAKREQNEKARPAYTGSLPDLSQYDTVFIGAPVWWGDWPMILYTVFENNDFSGKKLIPFSTHEGSGLSGFDRKLASACPDSEILDGLAVRGNDAQNRQESVRNSVNDWLAGLGY